MRNMYACMPIYDWRDSLSIVEVVETIISNQLTHTTISTITTSRPFVPRKDLFPLTLLKPPLDPNVQVQLW